MGQTGVWNWKVLPWLFGAAFLVTSAQGLSINICSSQDVTYPSFGGELGSRGVIYHNTSKESRQTRSAPCVTRFTICQDCGVNLTLQQNNFRGCYNRTQREITAAMSKNCDSRCTYLFAYDPNYFNATMKYFFAGEKWQYTAMSKRTVVGFCISAYDEYVKKGNFTMDYLIRTKSMTFVGSSQQPSSEGTIRSVNFPHGYVTDGDTYTYIIQSLNRDDFITLIFDDWDMDALSLIEFERANVERVEGSHYRPVVTSTRNWVRLTFSTGNRYGSILGRSMGFKLSYKFTSNRQEEEISTECGAYKLEDSGGILQFSGAPSTYRPVRFDCVWVIKQQPGFDKIFLKLLDSTIYKSSGWSEPNRFQVYSGLTSDSKHVRSFPPESTDVAKTGFKSNEGYYIRLTGTFYQDDKFKMAYASYSSLPAGSDQCTYGLFTCSNKRCIDRALKCDGADQCGDNSDETSCPSSSDWLPQGSSPFSLSISIIIPIVVAMFLVIVICLFVVFLRRCQQLQRRQPARNSQVPSVSGRMARGRRTRRSQIRVTIQQEYEDAPPTYEEAIGTPPNLGYFNMAFMWSQPDLPTGLMSPPPYAEVIGTPDEEVEGTPRYPVENDPNRQLTATDSLQSRRGRERREAQGQTRSGAERQSSGQIGQAPQTGDLHIVLRRNSNTPSSGTNSLEHNHSLGRQPLRVPVEAVYGNSMQQRNKSKDTVSPQISVTNEGAKDTAHQSTDSVQATEEVPGNGAGIEQPVRQASTLSATNAPDQPISPSNTNPVSKQKGGKGHRRRNRQRNPAAHSTEELSSTTSNQRSPNAARSSDILLPQPEATVRLGQRPGNALPPPLLRQSYSQADIPTSVEWSGPPDPRRASSAGRLLPDDRVVTERSRREADRTTRRQLSPVPQEESEREPVMQPVLHPPVPVHSADRTTRRQLSPVPQEESEPEPVVQPVLHPQVPVHSASSQAKSYPRGDVYDEEEEEYRQRLSQSSQQLRLFLRRSNSEDEDMYV